MPISSRSTASLNFANGHSGEPARCCRGGLVRSMLEDALAAAAQERDAVAREHSRRSAILRSLHMLRRWTPSLCKLTEKQQRGVLGVQRRRSHRLAAAGAAPAKSKSLLVHASSTAPGFGPGGTASLPAPRASPRCSLALSLSLPPQRSSRGLAARWREGERTGCCCASPPPSIGSERGGSFGAGETAHAERGERSAP
jgi:hypothetical protein